MAANSLGVLTLELVAQVGGFVTPIAQAEQASTSAFERMQNGVKKYGAVIGTAAIAAGAAIGAMTIETVHNANEIARLSAIAGTSTDAFQRMAAGAKAFGFEQDALADILKDTQEKMGEFSAVGGGGAIDFFEQIASKVGITTKSFENLSGADALQLYVSTLEKAGVGTKEMVFYMEAVASESSKLLPLLQNNGDALKLFGDAAAGAGAILDAETIEKANELKGALYLLDLQVTGIKNNIASQLVPTLLDLSNAFNAPAHDGDKLIDWARGFDGALRGIGAAALSVIGVLHTLGKAALVLPGALEPAFTAQKNPMEKIWANIKSRWAGVVNTNNEYGNRVDNLLAGNQVDGQTAKIGAALNQADEERKAAASREAGVKMQADKQAAYDKYIMLNASELQNVKYKYAQMRKEITANANFTAAERARATSAVNTAESTELATVRKRVADESKAKAEADAATRKRIADEASAKAKAAEAAQYQKRQELQDYAMMNATELDQLRSKFDTEREEVKRKTGWTVAERKRAIAEIDKAESLAVEDLKDKQAESLSVYADMNKTEVQLMRDKYAQMRKELDKNTAYTQDQRDAANEEIRQAEQRDARALRDAMRSKYDSMLSIQLEYNTELKRIEDSVLSDEEKKNYSAIAENRYNNNVDKQQKPFKDISQRLDGGLGEDNFDKLQEKYKTEREIILENTEGNELARQELLTKLQSEYHDAQMMTTLSYGSDIAGNMAGILKDMGQEQSKAYKVMFAVSKAFAIADAGIKIMQGIAAAAATPWPLNIGAMASVAAATAGLVGNIQSIRMVGQAHDGIMSVPESGTWNLQKGERVIPEHTAKRLDNTLERINSSAQGSGSMPPVNIYNYGTSKSFDVQVTPDEVRIIARDEVARGAGRAIASDMSNPNSDASKAMQRNLMVERRR